MSSGLLGVPGLRVRPQSVAAVEGVELGLDGSKPAGERVAVLAPAGSALLGEFTDAERTERGENVLVLAPRSASTLEVLRHHLPWLRPQVLGLRTSAGFGDRLGLATPGHIRALRAVGGNIAPVFAQQSIREMTRTHRSPREVVDDATWSVFAEGWREPFGADADHLKTRADIEQCLPIGYTFWTIDPGDEVDVSAETATADVLRVKVDGLPWTELEDTPEAFRRRYVDRSFEIEDQALQRVSVMLFRFH